jgi:D-glycero-alpha-D-manno-heptose-7-phosphate kinase
MPVEYRRRFALAKQFTSNTFHAVAETIVTRAPTRIDFGGGWTDVPPYSDEMGGYVCNVAISRYVTVSIGSDGPRVDSSDGDRSIAAAAAKRFGRRDAMAIASDFPIGAGLGGSSAAGVAVVSALCAATGRDLSRTEMAELSREIEISDLGIAGGRQDHYAAAYGGALGLRFRQGAVDVDRIALSPGLRDELERRCFVIYTGQSRISGDTIDAVIGAYGAREARVVNALERMKTLAEQMTAALRRANVDDLAQLVGEQWVHQRSLHPAIPTPRIDEIIARGMAAGALGAKALGASGGGCVVVIAAADREEAVRDAIAPLGQMLQFTIDDVGATRCL